MGSAQPYVASEPVHSKRAAETLRGARYLFLLEVALLAYLHFVVDIKSALQLGRADHARM